MKEYTLSEFQNMLHDADCKWCRKQKECDQCGGTGMAGVSFEEQEQCTHCGGRGWEGYEKVSLANQPVEHYDHEGGWTVKEYNKKQWLYVVCPKCDYQWALDKLGIPRT